MAQPSSSHCWEPSPGHPGARRVRGRGLCFPIPLPRRSRSSPGLSQAPQPTELPQGLDQLLPRQTLLKKQRGETISEWYL